jgi:hypothetical protein
LLRGRYINACARVEWNGIPADLDWWEQLVAYREPLLRRYVSEHDKPYGVYGDGLSWSDTRFRQYLHRAGIPWRSHAKSNRPVLDEEFIGEMVRAYPELAGLQQIRSTIKALQKPGLAIGIDGRNRVPVSPVGTITGRNAPRAGKYLFGPARWLRSIIRPTPGRSLAYVDWVAQEIAIAAALSKDIVMQTDYESGDPYLAFAIATGLAPTGATRATHEAIRDPIKVLFLASNYGMGAASFALQARISEPEARELLELHRARYRTYWHWIRRIVERADLTSRINTCLGWQMHVLDNTRETTLQNWMMQACGAELMRVAAIALTEAPIRVCAIVHDAFLIEAPTAELDAVINFTEQTMRRAGEELLGVTIRTESSPTHYPDRFRDEKGGFDTWQQVDNWISQIGDDDGSL